MKKAIRQSTGKKRDRLKPLSLYPLTPERALSAFMCVDPTTVKRAMARRAKRVKRK